MSSVLSARKVKQILGAELYKLVSLPLIWFALVGTFIFNLILTAAFTSNNPSGTIGTEGILGIGLASMSYLQAGFIILGILAACSEYAGGQIRTTLTTMPWRGFQLTTKYLALVMITIPAAFIMVTSGILYALIMLREETTGIEINTMIKTLTGATGYLTLTTLISAATGTLLRRTVPALVVLLGYYIIISPLFRVFQFQTSVVNYFPETAGYYMYMPPSVDETATLTQIQGTGILLLWVLLFIAVAIVFYRKRDA